MYNITNEQYYTNGGNNPTSLYYGSYQYVSLEDIITNYMAMYVGPDKLINRVQRNDVIWFAKQGIQKFEYNAANTPKVLELTIDSTGVFVAPPDFVGLVKISYEQNGILYDMIPHKQKIHADSYLQDVNGELIFDVDGNVIGTSSMLDQARIDGLTQKIYLGQGQFYGQLGWCLDGMWYFGYSRRGRLGAEPDLMNVNPTYQFDKAGGVFYFGSDLVDKHVVLEYISDGLKGGDDSKVVVHKFAEAYIYAFITYSIMKTRRGYADYEIARVQKEMISERNNAKISLGGFKFKELLMTLRNQGKWLK